MSFSLFAFVAESTPYTVLESHPDTLYMIFRSCPSNPGTAFDDILREITAGRTPCSILCS